MTIIKANNNQAESVFEIFRDCRLSLESNGIFQWTDQYPTLETIRNDIRSGHLYCLAERDQPTGVVTISTIQDAEYNTVQWQFRDAPVLVIHRLAVRPQYQERGFASRLMDFAESHAVCEGYRSIRLDAYSGNPSALRFYEKRNYIKRGEVFFAGRKLPFFCYEKYVG